VCVCVLGVIKHDAQDAQTAHCFLLLCILKLLFGMFKALTYKIYS
jgi:hypothetical protein